MKILVPLDGSELAAKILPYVVDLAKTYSVQEPAVCSHGNIIINLRRF